MTDATATCTVGLVMERRQGVTAWAGELWRPVAVLPGVPDMAAGTSLGMVDGGEHVYAGAFDIQLHRSDTATYRDNLTTLAPLVWVAFRLRDGEMPEIAAITVDPAEGEMYSETGSEQLDSVKMPAEVAGVLAEFIAEHHVERAFVKRKRKRWADEDAEDMA